MTDPRIAFIVGKGAWTLVGWEGRTDLVRFALNRDKKTWRIAEVRLLEPTGETFRAFPFFRIENAANASSIVALGLAVGHTQEPDDPADIASMFRRLKPVPQDRLRLRRPKGRQLDASFFKQVALAYKGALAEGLNPRQTLARDSGAAPDTVARWIGKARERGYLPKTTPGKPAAHGEVKD